jgi:hypothetical protein
MAEYLPTKHEALNSIPSTQKKKNNNNQKPFQNSSTNLMQEKYPKHIS